MQRRIGRSAICAALLLVTVAAEGAPLETTCAKFVAAYEARGRSSQWPPSADYTDYRWYEGYVAGWLVENGGAPEGSALVAEIVDAATRWLDAHCRAHPDEALGKALEGFSRDADP